MKINLSDQTKLVIGMIMILGSLVALAVIAILLGYGVIH